jgi:hypothetical protein
MARRQHTYTSGVEIKNAVGTGVTFNIVRIMRWNESPPNREVNIAWELGKIDEGDWVPSGQAGSKSYTDSAYDTLLAISTSAGQEDQIYQDLVTDGVIAAGSQGNYPS